MAKKHSLAFLSLLSLLFLATSACSPFAPLAGDDVERRALAGSQKKTWSITKVVINGKLQPLSDGIKALTRTYFLDGRWQDNLGAEGHWVIEPSQRSLQEEIRKPSPFATRPTTPRSQHRIVAIHDRLLILESESLEIGTGEKGFGSFYLEPTE